MICEVLRVNENSKEVYLGREGVQKRKRKETGRKGKGNEGKLKKKRERCKDSPWGILIFKGLDIEAERSTNNIEEKRRGSRILSRN